MKSELQDKIITHHADPSEDLETATKKMKADAAKQLTAAHATEAHVYAFFSKPTQDGGADLTLHMRYSTDTTPAKWLDAALPELDVQT